MIARTWHGRVPASQADAYHDYLNETGVTDYLASAGNCGLLVQRWTEGSVTHYALTTLWSSIEAIKQFAGEDYTLARYYPRDDEFLLEREPYVSHTEVLLAVMPPQLMASKRWTPHAGTGALPSLRQRDRATLVDRG